MTVTGEYRSGMIRTTFAASPEPHPGVVAKAVVAAVVFGDLHRGAGDRSGDRGAADRRPLLGLRLSLTETGVWRVAGALALYAALAAVLGVAVGALLRYVAGAVAVLLLWPLVVEPLLGNMPNIGSQVGPYLPFGNAFVFIDVQWLYPDYAMPWGPARVDRLLRRRRRRRCSSRLVTVNRRDA